MRTALLATMLALGTFACSGGGSSPGNDLPDGVVDTGADTTPDVPADLPGDLPADAPADVPADTVLDVPADSPDVPAAETVRVIRDPWGVPHVIATTDRGAGYGYGYALAEDRMVDALQAYWSVQGRRTEIEGEAALEFDRSQRLFRLVADVEAQWDSLPADVKEIAEGYTDGFNRYMAEHPEQVPAWAEPIRKSWPIALGGYVFLDMEVSRAERDHDASVCPRLPTLDTGLSDKRYGSNGFAIAPSRTATGVGYMGGDPHLPWKHEYRFHEAHLRGKTFEVAGAAWIGVPLPVLGRTAHVAWTWTSNSPDYGDAYLLQLDPANPDHYLFDGESVPFETREDSFKMADGTVKKVTLRWSRPGPVACLNTETNRGVALRISNWGMVDSSKQILAMYRAKDLAEAEQAMSMLLFPHFNLVGQDTKGHVSFVWNSRVPIRPKGYVPDGTMQDGTRSDVLWGYGDDAMIPYDQMPAVRDPEIGFIENCNNRPETVTGTSADPLPSSYLPGVVEGDEVDEVRSFYLRHRLAAETKWTEELALGLITDGYMIPHDPLKDLVVYAWTAYGADYEHKAEVEPLVELLRDWDGMPTLESGAPTLFLVWLFYYADTSFIPVSMLSLTPADVDPVMGAAMLKALYDARQMIEGVAGMYDVPWGLIHVIHKGGEVFPVYTGQYPAISLMNGNLDPTTVESFDDFNCTVGSAYTFLNVMEEPIRTYSVHAVGQTDRTDLPYATAQTALFAQRELKPLPFTDAEIAAHTASQVVLEVPAAGW